MSMSSRYSKKLKVYLDTSVISHLQQEDAIDKTKITNDLWLKFKNGFFDVALSDLTLLEICRDGVRAISMIKGYKNINILNPMTLLEMEV